MLFWNTGSGGDYKANISGVKKRRWIGGLGPFCYRTQGTGYAGGEVVKVVIVIVLSHRDLSSEGSFIQIRQRSEGKMHVLHQIQDPQIEEMVVQQGEQNTLAESQDTNLNYNIPLSPKGSKEQESGTKYKYASVVWDHFTIVEGTRKVPIRFGINGSRPPHFCKNSGSVARHILQQLAAMNIVDIDPKGGRRITSTGQRDLDQVAGRIVPVP
ncbi:hypothetical protein GIB67_032611 [Kingdonia uniflora]|uniref:40S ribosomal protein S19 n=1 Tax=Kingdonia uniflora TaxID=39325 RepID=A0A7J7L577_9MAGN|nr:hypothetical protein GIB67_032611 [Kingdonia uniflora]